MYNKYTDSIQEYLLNKVRPALEKARHSNFDTALLKEWKTRWAHQKLIVQGLSKLFMYLDRFYTPNTDNVASLREQGFKLYKENVFDVFHSSASQAILNAIDKERANTQQDRQLLGEAMLVFVEMGTNYAGKKLSIYTELLERPIVAHAGEHYKRQSREWLDQDSAPIYMEKVEKVLASERERVENYLNRQTIEPLHKACYDQMLKAHIRELLQKKTGLAQMLSLHALEDLSRLYRLYKGNEAELEVIAEMFGEHIKAAGSEVVEKARPQAQAKAAGEEEEKEEKKEEEKAGASAALSGAAAAAAAVDANHALVRNLISLHASYNEIVTGSFEKTQIMQKALKKAFEDFINKDNRVSKLLAKFVNDVLRKGSKVNVKDIEATLDNVVFLYGYIQEKDVFERDYQQFLSQRLLMSKCESEHSEKSMIAKLKTECGQSPFSLFLSLSLYFSLDLSLSFFLSLFFLFLSLSSFHFFACHLRFLLLKFFLLLFSFSFVVAS